MADDDDVQRAGAAAERAVRRQLTRLRRVVEQRGIGARVGVAILGIVLVAVGMILLIVPGPGMALGALGRGGAGGSSDV